MIRLEFYGRFDQALKGSASDGRQDRDMGCGAGSTLTAFDHLHTIMVRAGMRVGSRYLGFVLRRAFWTGNANYSDPVLSVQFPSSASRRL